MEDTRFVTSVLVWGVKHLHPRFPDNNPSTCYICREPFDSDVHIAVEITGIPKCKGHIFGASCFVDWAVGVREHKQATCPICRTALFNKSESAGRIVDVGGEGAEAPEDVVAAQAYARLRGGEYDFRVEQMSRIADTVRRELSTFEHAANELFAAVASVDGDGSSDGSHDAAFDGGSASVADDSGEASVTDDLSEDSWLVDSNESFPDDTEATQETERETSAFDVDEEPEETSDTDEEVQVQYQPSEDELRAHNIEPVLEELRNTYGDGLTLEDVQEIFQSWADGFTPIPILDRAGQFEDRDAALHAMLPSYLLPSAEPEEQIQPEPARAVPHHTADRLPSAILVSYQDGDAYPLSQLFLDRHHNWTPLQRNKARAIIIAGNLSAYMSRAEQTMVSNFRNARHTAAEVFPTRDTDIAPAPTLSENARHVHREVSALYMAAWSSILRRLGVNRDTSSITVLRAGGNLLVPIALVGIVKGIYDVGRAVWILVGKVRGA